jgi:hypothetical protein
MRRAAALLLGCAGIIAPASSARAASSSAQGSGGLSAAASIDFKIVIPEVLSLRVGVPIADTQRVNFDPATPQVRVARGGVALGLSSAGASTGNGMMLSSNMRQVTVVQDSGPRTTVTVATP